MRQNEIFLRSVETFFCCSFCSQSSKMTPFFLPFLSLTECFHFLFTILLLLLSFLFSFRFIRLFISSVFVSHCLMLDQFYLFATFCEYFLLKYIDAIGFSMCKSRIRRRRRKKHHLFATIFYLIFLRLLFFPHRYEIRANIVE